MRYSLLACCMVFALPACDKEQTEAQAEPGIDTRVEVVSAIREEDSVIDWPDWVPAADRNAIEEAWANDGVLASKLDELLDAVNSGASREHIEERYGPPDEVDGKIAVYKDERFSIPIYASLKGLAAVRIAYDDDGVASYAGSTRN